VGKTDPCKMGLEVVMARKLALVDVARMSEAGKKPGWTSRPGAQVIANENPSIDTRVLHVMWCDGDNVLYDQILRCERGGGVFLPVDQNGKVGLLKQWRPQTTDMKAWQASYPNMDVSLLGRESWELPRGFAKTGETTADTAVREAQEETQSVVTSANNLGDVCDNTAFSPHLTGIQIGSIDMSKKPTDKPDPNEKLLAPVTFFTLLELKQMVARGEIYDGYTLAALGLYFIQKYAK
jgi:ADP-ribose pyrophosphatase YjhB (NUDIX family)